MTKVKSINLATQIESLDFSELEEVARNMNNSRLLVLSSLCLRVVLERMHAERKESYNNET